MLSEIHFYFVCSKKAVKIESPLNCASREEKCLVRSFCYKVNEHPNPNFCPRTINKKNIRLGKFIQKFSADDPFSV